MRARVTGCVRIYGGLIDYLAKRECDVQICSHARR